MKSKEYLDKYVVPAKRSLVKVFIDTGNNIYYLDEEDEVPDLANVDIYIKVGKQGWEGCE